MTDLPALLSRLRAATGPDRELDADICVALQYLPFDPTGVYYVWKNETLHDSWIAYGVVSGISDAPVIEPPTLTGSIDAAVDLVERMLPEWGRRINFDPKTSTACVYLHSPARAEDTHSAIAPTEPLAILIATIEALMAREGQR